MDDWSLRLDFIRFTFPNCPRALAILPTLTAIISATIAYKSTSFIISLVDALEYHGLDIETDGSVYEPAEDSLLAAEVADQEIKNLGVNLSMLDMGCGSGIIGLSAALNKNVAKVLFADKNPAAISLCKRNLLINSNLIDAKCSVVKSDLFSEVNGMFDLIVFNAPYLPDGKDDDLGDAWYGGDDGIGVSSKFLEQSYKHLGDNGSIVLIASSLSNIDGLYCAINDCDLMVVRDAKVHINFEDIIALVLKKQLVIGS